MTPLYHALGETLDHLIALTRDGARPGEARARLRALQERHPDTALDLVWEEEVYDGSVHYDVLLHLPGEGTVSLGFCSDRALPWPLRGVHRWSEADLVRVNTTILQVDQAIGCLDFLWEDRCLMDRLVNVCLIQEALEQDPIQLSGEDLQEAMDGFRRAHRLCTAEETYRWMARRGMTHEQMEKYVADEALVARLRDRVTDGRVEEYFEAHRAAFDSARIARIDFAGEDDARRAYEQIRAGEVDFFEAALRRFLGVDGRREQPSAGLFAVLRRGETPARLADAIFAATAGDVVGPVRTEDGSAVVRILDVLPARLDGPTQRAIATLLFEAWLEERRCSARIEWNWGNVNRTEWEGSAAAG